MMFTNNDLLIFDTSSLLDLYRHPIINSKRILDYLKEYNDRIWIPARVKEEFYRNKNVKNINMYKKFKESTKKETLKLEQKLLRHINEYSKSRFSNLEVLEDEIKNKFAEICGKIEEYNELLKSESEIYKKFILNDVDNFLNILLNGEKVGKPINTVELINIIKEGELRYKYKIAPGYEDDKAKVGIDKFGDLIIWKEIIAKSQISKEKNIFFITSDSKPDWFKRDNNGKNKPCKELIDEFNYYVENKKINIMTMSDFIESLVDKTNDSDFKLLLELRKDIVVNGITNIIENFVNDYVDDHTLTILEYSPDNLPSEIMVGAIDIEKFNINNIKLVFKNNEVIYNLDIQLNMGCDVTIEDEYFQSYGYMNFLGNIKLGVSRSINISENNFINSFDNSKIIINRDLRIEDSKFILDMVDEDADARAEAMEALEEYYYH